MTKTLSNLEIGWLAGLFEGEGCFSWDKRPAGLQGVCRVRLGMTDLDTVQRVVRLVPAFKRIYIRNRTPPHKRVYYITAHGDNAASFMRLLLPHMGDRRTHKIVGVLCQWERRVHKGRGSNPPRGADVHCSRLETLEVLEIRRLWNTGQVQQAVLAQMFGVGRPSINAIVHRRSWAHI